MSNARRAKAFARALDSAANALQTYSEMVVAMALAETRDAVVSETPRETGRLANGWVIDGTRLFNPVEYAEDVEYGPSGGMLRRNTNPAVMRERLHRNSKKAAITQGG